MSVSLDNLCVHTITTKSWNLETAASKYAAAGVKGMSIWRDAAQAYSGGMTAAGQMVRDEGLDIVSYVRGGFFTGFDATDRQKAIDENKQIIDEAAELGAPLIVLVVGATPGQSLFDSRQQITDGIAAVLPHAEAAGVKLGIEPLHPMYADSRSAVNTMAQSNAICDTLDHPFLGIALDVFHVWWDDQLEAQTKIAGEKNRLFAFHICDWKDQPEDMLNDRGLMGEGVIDIPQIRTWVNASGFSGYEEVEIFSNKYWAMNQDEYLELIKKAYLETV
ncbi:MAG: sugar phosphate isomerase/epimerase [Verrucomicrobia bacterium]|nr:sugar phosphate isomerase/epimerase [Verrucomicrobiota bacterium]MDA1065890.1 sugar phosphate isomerase/epimerase [Verrucomicrobiota bacterium]